MQQLVDKAVSPRRFVVLLLGGFSAFALVLASLGIYGVISYRSVSGAGDRHSHGARRLRDACSGASCCRRWLAGIGIVLGTAASWALARLLTGFLFGVTSNDPVTFLGMVIVLTAVAVTAGYLPARRASRIDPMSALRAS